MSCWRRPSPRYRGLCTQPGELRFCQSSGRANLWVSSALTAASRGTQQTLQQGNLPELGQFVFLMNKCSPAPLGWVGEWKEENSGDESVLIVLHPDQHMLSTNKGGQNSRGLLSSSLPSFLLKPGRFSGALEEGPCPLPRPAGTRGVMPQGCSSSLQSSPAGPVGAGHGLSKQRLCLSPWSSAVTRMTRGFVRKGAGCFQRGPFAKFPACRSLQYCCRNRRLWTQRGPTCPVNL